jgi:putative serine protease PepD
MKQQWQLREQHTGQTYPIRANNPLTIGRSPNSKVVIVEDDVSRHHAQVVLDPYGLSVQDLNSANGTFVNEQRIGAAHPLQLNDMVRIGSQTYIVEMGSAQDGPDRILLIGGAVAVLILFVVIMYGGNDSGPSAWENTPPVRLTAGAQGIKEDAQAKLDQALTAAVFIIAPTVKQESARGYNLGSGSVVHAEGYILTNAHVVGLYAGSESKMTYHPYQYVDIFMNSAGPSNRPTYEYVAETIEYDAELDLALLKIVADKDGQKLSNSKLNLATIPLGHPDQLRPGDPLTIVGFPSAGRLADDPNPVGSVTVTTGSVAGFTDRPGEGVANPWIKTDAVVGHGNSGGMALNQQYELIGVPTQINSDFFESSGAAQIGYVHSIEVAKQILGRIPK